MSRSTDPPDMTLAVYRGRKATATGAIYLTHSATQTVFGFN